MSKGELIYQLIQLDDDDSDANEAANILIVDEYDSINNPPIIQRLLPMRMEDEVSIVDDLIILEGGEEPKYNCNAYICMMMEQINGRRMEEPDANEVAPFINNIFEEEEEEEEEEDEWNSEEEEEEEEEDEWNSEEEEEEEEEEEDEWNSEDEDEEEDEWEDEWEEDEGFEDNDMEDLIFL